MDQHMHHHHGSMGHTTVSPSAMSTLAGAIMTAVTNATAHGMHGTSSSNDSLQDPMLSDGYNNHFPFVNPHHSTVLHTSSAADHMVMYFNVGVDTVILFKDWKTSSAQGLFGSVVVIFLMAMMYEGIKFFREYMFKKYFTSLEYSSVSVLGDDGRTVTEVHKVARNRMFSWPHTIQTVLHMVQMILSYFLMLIFMTYNVWLCLGVVLGAGTGYFLFGWKKATVVDITEHCH